MHLTHEMNANSNHNRNNNNSITTTTSCTSSTDSGVILLDNDRQHHDHQHQHQHHYNTRIHDCSNDNDAGDDDDNSSNNTQDNDNEMEDIDCCAQLQEQQQLNIRHTNTQRDDNKLTLNLNLNGNAKQQQQQQLPQQETQRANDRSYAEAKSTAATVMLTTSTKANNNNTSSNNKCSPTLSIRSTTISIISIDENAIDSSVIDSDTDLEADAEGVHSSYVVKKLGQQTTYAPNSPEIPNINKGLTVLSQTISPFTGGGGGGGVGGDLIPTPVASAAPQIGSIALTNSSDVTFGDKHFYEGPVTIQQFLIDNREKWKKSESEYVDGQDNPLYADEERNAQEQRATGGFNSKAATTAGGNNAPGHHHQPYKYMYKRKAIFISGAVLALIILIGLTVALATRKSTTSKQLGDGDDSRKNIPIDSTIDNNDSGDGDDNGAADADSCPGDELCWVLRPDWMARDPKPDVTKLALPVHRIIIAHTATGNCKSQPECIDRVRIIQNYHMDSFGWSDIAYNFLVGGDGRVYVGRSWSNMGSHTKGYNNDSLAIAFIGTYTISEPNKKQQLAAKLLIDEGVLQLKIAPDYRLYGARQLSSTESPGEALFNIIKKWAHWSKDV